MKVLFVVNNFYAKGNGLSGSARRTVRKLKEAGLDVRVLSGANPDPTGPEPEFQLQDYRIPFFDKLVRKQGYSFSKTETDIITEAIQWADVVHIEEPFAIQMAACKIAKKLGKPLVGTYHLHPENLFASVGLEKSRVFNGFTMRMWQHMVFDKCEIVQCPTENVRERLERHHFKAELRVISNGLVREDLLTRRDKESAIKVGHGKYNIITIGRYSNEKDLKTLLNAMKYSKYADDIQLIFCGRGPQKKKLRHLAAVLVNKGVIKIPPIFGFYSLDELQKISLAVDLYIHCAFIEVEGLSCMEAIQIGIVPIIAEGKHTATSQFALSEMSKFKERDPKDLAAKIDYWLDHPQERKTEAKKYIGLGEQYNIDYSIKQIIKMYEDVLAKHEKVAK